MNIELNLVTLRNNIMNRSLPTLPMDVIYHLMQFLPWWLQAQPLSKLCIRHALDKQIVVRHWKSKRLLFSYLMLWGPRPSWSWKFFAMHVCRLKKRARNRSFELRWKAAAIRHMTQQRCQSCGRTTSSNVFGTYLCKSCRCSKRKVHAYMLTTGQAKAYTGISKRLLDTIPYHRGPMGARLRFAIDIHQLLFSCPGRD